MQPVISASQMREIDRRSTSDYQIPSILLMQAAAEACLQAISTHFSGSIAGKKAQILCGPGNNGGDGAALAHELSRAGAHADVVLFGMVDQTRGDARTNFEIDRKLSEFEAGSNDCAAPLSFVECQTSSSWEQLAQPRRTFDIIVDALFGTGLSRPLDGLLVQVVQHLTLVRTARERSSAIRPFIVSIDIPSGLNADSAQIVGEAVHADLTVTFTAPKPANVLPPASHLNGELVIANIGSPAQLIESVKSTLFLTDEAEVRDWLVNTRYSPGSFKNSHGHVLVVAGSRDYTGAAVLCGDGAMRSGAGMVTVATAASVQPSIAARLMPEVITTALAETDRGAISEKAIDHVLQLASKVSVVAIGPGLSADDERTRQFVISLLRRRKVPTVVDADALNCVAASDPSGWPKDLLGSDDAPLILTPHPGEMLRLLGTTDKGALNDRVEVARQFATKHKLILVLKGERSFVAAPDGRVFANPTGNAGLGTAGAGDTLTGLIAGFIAQAVGAVNPKADVLSSTIAALYVGGLAGDLAARHLGMRTMVASDIRDHFSEAVRLLDPEGEKP
ncbi:MAG: NAD(P)H-hydrate dehydratase [Pyrinomonadaceae bacterium]